MSHFAVLLPSIAGDPWGTGLGGVPIEARTRYVRLTVQ
jgi:hypothetical protein